MTTNVNRINQSNDYSTRLSRPRIQREYSALNMGYARQGTGDMGKLIPVHLHELIPGQRINLKQDAGLQFMPFVSNLFHEIEGEILTYFVPYRLLWDKWEDFITGGVTGTNTDVPPTINIKTLWEQKPDLEENERLPHTLADYFGMPIANAKQMTNAAKTNPVAFPWRAYNKIYNDHIRIPDFEPDEIDLDNNETLNGNWQWDYFTRARIYQQRGIIPSVPINDTESQLIHETSFGKWEGSDWVPSTVGMKTGALRTGNPTDENAFYQMWWGADVIPGGDSMHKDTLKNNSVHNIPGTSIAFPNIGMRIMPHNLEALGVNMNDFLIALGIMRIQINNAKIETRYVDHLKVRWGIYPQDARLQRPEYLGSTKFGVTTEIIAQTAPGASGQTQQGNLTGQAWANGRNSVSYEAKEHGIIMSLMIVRPKTVYEGGLDKMWIKKNRFDFPTPELANLPDVEVKTGELLYKGESANWLETDGKLFGWQGIFEEYRTATNVVTGLLRPSINNSLKSYTLARYWEWDKPPVLNADFVHCVPDKARILQFPEQPTFIFFVRNDTNTAIPLPIQSEPAELANI